MRAATRTFRPHTPLVKTQLVELAAGEVLNAAELVDPLRAGPCVAASSTGSSSPEDAELVAFRVGEDHPGLVSLTDVDPRRSQSDQAFNLGLLIIGTKIEMQPILHCLGIADGQKQQTGQPTLGWPDSGSATTGAPYSKRHSCSRRVPSRKPRRGRTGPAAKSCTRADERGVTALGEMPLAFPRRRVYPC